MLRTHNPAEKTMPKENKYKHRKPKKPSGPVQQVITHPEIVKNAAPKEKEKLAAFIEALRLYNLNPQGEAPSMPDEHRAGSPASSEASEYVVIPVVNPHDEYDIVTRENLGVTQKPASPKTGKAAMFQPASPEKPTAPAQPGGVLSYLSSWVPGFGK